MAKNERPTERRNERLENDILICREEREVEDLPGGIKGNTEILIFKSRTVNTLSARPIPLCEIPRLEHKVIFVPLTQIK
jgi:hypothetical protein